MSEPTMVGVALGFLNDEGEVEFSSAGFFAVALPEGRAPDDVRILRTWPVRLAGPDEQEGAA